jgi:hypothetical protein
MRQHQHVANHKQFKLNEELFMAKTNLPDFELLIQQQIDDNENITRDLDKAKALLLVALGHDFSNQQQYAISDYISAILDFVEHAWQLNAKVVNELMLHSPRDVTKLMELQKKLEEVE